ncbi:hypothetical protein Sste5344_001581 [Sporothrix stenoceras]
MGKFSDIFAKLRHSEDKEELSEAQKMFIERAQAQAPVKRARRDLPPETEFVVTRRRVPFPVHLPPPKEGDDVPFKPPAVDVTAPEHYTKMGSTTKTVVVQTGEMLPVHVATTTTLFLDKRVYPPKRLLHSTVMIQAPPQ